MTVVYIVRREMPMKKRRLSLEVKFIDLEQD